MAFTAEQEQKLAALADAISLDGFSQIDDLPVADFSASDKKLEVFNATKGRSEQMSLVDAVSLGQALYCGRVWNLDNATPVAVSTVGSVEMLQQLPDLLQLGCYLVKNDHTRQKLDSQNHHLLATGERAKLDGTDGHYMWGWGRKWYLSIESDGHLLSIFVSLQPIPGKFNYEIPIASTSAMGHGVMDRESGTLVSFINETAQYRGGNNNSEWDGTYRSLLGMPATNMTCQQFLTAARKNGEGWTGGSVRMHAAIAYLFYVIFGTFNVQTAYNENKDANGLYQGGFGPGVSSFSAWSSYNGANPIIPTDAGIELGDACGISDYEVKDENGDTVYTAHVPCFFGLKNFYGHLWRMMTDEQFQANEDTSLTHLIATHIFGTFNIGNAEGFKAYTTTPTQVEGWVKKASLANLELCPTAVGGSETTYFCDYFYNTSGATSGFRVVARGGSAYYGGKDGLACVYGGIAVSYAAAYDGSPLCEFSEEWSVDPVYADKNA